MRAGQKGMGIRIKNHWMYILIRTYDSWISSRPWSTQLFFWTREFRSRSFQINSVDFNQNWWEVFRDSDIFMICTWIYKLGQIWRIWWSFFRYQIIYSFQHSESCTFCYLFISSDLFIVYCFFIFIFCFLFFFVLFLVFCFFIILFSFLQFYEFDALWRCSH